MDYKITSRQYSSKMCFVCGLENGHGLHTRFYETASGEVIGRCTPCEHHQSYPGRLHGGVSSSLLDEAIGRAVSVGTGDTVWGVTLELTLKYRKPVPYGKPVTVIGRVDEDLGRMFTGSAEIVLADGSVAVSATGRYLKQSADRITGEDISREDWEVVDMEPMPDTIEIPSGK